MVLGISKQTIYNILNRNKITRKIIQIKVGEINNREGLNEFMERFIRDNNKKGYEGYFEKAYNLMGV